jgi:hypothetical protein
MLRWALAGLALGALAGFALGLVRPRTRLAYTPWSDPDQPGADPEPAEPPV